MPPSSGIGCACFHLQTTQQRRWRLCAACQMPNTPLISWKKWWALLPMHLRRGRRGLVQARRRKTLVIMRTTAGVTRFCGGALCPQRDGSLISPPKASSTSNHLTDGNWPAADRQLDRRSPRIARAYFRFTERPPDLARPRVACARACRDPDTEGLLLLIRFEIERKLSLVGWRQRLRSRYEHVPSENWKGARRCVPVPAVELRQKTAGDDDERRSRRSRRAVPQPHR